MSALLSVDHVGVRFGGVQAIKDVSFDVASGEILGLIGPNGAGKTTLLNVISSLVKPSGGRVMFDGETITGRKAHTIARRGVARTFQIVQPFRNLTVAQNVAVGAMFCDAGRSATAVAEACTEAMEQVGIAGKRDFLPSQLTLSERKRLEVARALATRPRLLLLDEVMAGLNHAEIERIIDLIRAINRNGLTIIVVEHVMKAITAVCHRAVVLQFGEKIADGTPDRVLSDPKVVSAYLGDRYARRQVAQGAVA
ncbi:ABC transporter ATP-binding protein [Methylobacterium isbiliense]|jgi:branched-chain amino acid transport system ATP-binding protein|uniref:Lipopolysaccharide export system ATP-binding protein LptB n=1 Tax=Methylobacterium isbiliense TaxID=315478 RepID=A0ABQ4SM61_9HYPH|nr:ABC transporter ATP-binding protein [Methylobacterium isbiliense]MDN3627134.1 ABC transporter ATP-binding protein [Methylobacterium isbiliense]GJE03610.1 Lipopolysaccharide export system ATP-binding protein LptB [Methylobacterium isbiliense]